VPRLEPDTFKLVGRCGRERRLGRLPGQGHDHEVAEPLQQVLHEAARIVSRADDVVDHPEQRGAIAGGERLDGVIEQARGREAEERRGTLVVEFPVRCAGDQLVEHRQRIPDRAGPRADDHRQHPGTHADRLLAAQPLEVSGEHPRWHQPERVVVGPRADGPDDLLRFGGREDELDVVRRLLHELQQRVEALGGDHVGLVEDEDLVAVPGRGEGGALTELARVVDPVVGRGVNLDDVERAAAASRQLAARVAGAARGVRGALGAVEAAGEDAGGGGLPAATRAREEVGVGDPAGAEGSHQRLRHVLLADHLTEGVRPVAAVEGCGHKDDGMRLH